METANGKVGGWVSVSKSERAGLGGKIVGGEKNRSKTWRCVRKGMNNRARKKRERERENGDKIHARRDISEFCGYARRMGL